MKLLLDECMMQIVAEAEEPIERFADRSKNSLKK